MPLARPARLQHAVRVAPHTGSVCAPEIALLTGLQAAVAAGHDSVARLPRGGTHPPRLDAAGARTSVATLGVVIVAGLARLADAAMVEDAQGVVVEEAAEVWMAAEHESAERTAEEISQLLYRIQVIMLGKGIGLEDVYRHL